jgi:hypothetical protein
MTRWAEKMRRAADLEHWAAFRSSFERLADLFALVGRGEHAGSGGAAPGTICALSGDVHHAYAAKANYPDDVRSKIYQLTCSPVHNYVPAAIRLAFRLSWSRAAERVTDFLLSRVSQVPPAELDWSRLCGPLFGDQIATLTLDGRSATVLFEQAGTDPRGRPELTPAATVPLT